MKKAFVATLLVALCASAALAEDGRPSAGKLNNLGLSSMQVASDHDGMQVRGKAFTKIIFTWSASAGEKAVLTQDTTTDPVTNNLTIDPAAYVAHDFNNGAGITSDGVPLQFGSGRFAGSYTSQIALVEADAFHQQDVLDSAGNVAFSEISASLNSAFVFGGRFSDFYGTGPVIP